MGVYCEQLLRAGSRVACTHHAARCNVALCQSGPGYEQWMETCILIKALAAAVMVIWDLERACTAASAVAAAA